MTIDVSELKYACSKLSLAIEKSKLNPQAGWVELIETNPQNLKLKVSNFGYYVEMDVGIVSSEEEQYLHATVVSDTFIPLISKLDGDVVTLTDIKKAIKLKTPSSEYTIPVILDKDKPACVEIISFDEENAEEFTLNAGDVVSVSQANVKGLIDSVFSLELQSYIYMDNIGAITYTENIYVNNFKYPTEKAFKVLLNATQSKLLNIFKGVESEVRGYISVSPDYESANKMKLCADKLSVTMIIQSSKLTDQFPSIRIRDLARISQDTHVTVDRSKVNRALDRLMVFEKQSPKTQIIQYSKILFREKYMRLESMVNKNHEDIYYDNAVNVFDRDVVVRFSDLQKQIKNTSSKALDISYGDVTKKAITINSDIIQVIPEIECVED